MNEEVVDIADVVIKGKKNKKIGIIASFLVPLFFILIYVGFISNSNNFDNLPSSEKMYEIYLLASSSGYDGTYEDWLNSISGKTVEIEIDYIYKDGERYLALLWRQVLYDTDGNYSYEGNWSPIYNLDNYMGYNAYELWKEVIKKPQIGVGDFTQADWDALTEADFFKEMYSSETYSIEFLSYSGNGNSALATEYAITEGNLIMSSPEITIATGYQFDGWYVEGTGQKWELDFYVVKSSLVLEAKFSIITSPVEYVLNGGINYADNPTTIKYTDNITLKDPEREGYNFLGWYNNINYTGSSVTSLVGISSHTILYAKWEVKKYDVTYVLSTGEIVTYKDEYTYGEQIAVKTTDLSTYDSKEYFTIEGYYLDSTHGYEITNITSDLILNETIIVYVKASFNIVDNTIRFSGVTCPIIDSGIGWATVYVIGDSAYSYEVDETLTKLYNSFTTLEKNMLLPLDDAHDNEIISLPSYELKIDDMQIWYKDKKIFFDGEYTSSISDTTNKKVAGLIKIKL